ncbi:MAG: hypothetical protein V3S18_00625 [Dehalococcoidia bacterium]
MGRRPDRRHETEGEYRTWLAGAGFPDATRVREPRFAAMRAVKSG